ncbi:MAG: hypothetical protein F4145_01110 [Boseongicola sp. SB0675_bin_26]|nr:hypothetical protein [Boseongicola sp. SB0675_bin_26]
MPYENQRATGEALISLQQSKLFEEFKGRIRPPPPRSEEALEPTAIPEAELAINRVITIDGSLVTETLKDGFPGAEASLVQLALVYIDLRKLKAEGPGRIIPPRAFNEMDDARTLQTVLPGRNVVRNDGLQPRDFFRHSVFEALQGKIVQSGHETLLETFEHLVKGRHGEFRCPHDELCGNQLRPITGCGKCACERDKEIYSTDQMRFHERFSEMGPNGEPHGEVMRFLELILLLNVLRYFVANDDAVHVLPRIAFVLDGPLAAFGQFASVVPRVKEEVRRISEECRDRTGKDLLLFSLVKSGQFVEHFERIDFDPKLGPGGRFQARTALLPNIAYIHRNIVFRAPDAKEWGKSTYFGRAVLYKSRTGQKMVVNTAMTSDASDDLSNTTLAAYTRLPETLGIVDRLSTYLFEGGFVPIVRAHSHAAIPLKIGGEILQSLFEDDV